MNKAGTLKKKTPSVGKNKFILEFKICPKVSHPTLFRKCICMQESINTRGEARAQTTLVHYLVFYSNHQ